MRYNDISYDSCHNPFGDKVSYMHVMYVLYRDLRLGTEIKMELDKNKT